MNVSPHPLQFLDIQHSGIWQCRPPARGLNRQNSYGSQRIVDEWTNSKEEFDDDSPRDDSMVSERLAVLQDKRLSVAGDLGWSLDYATVFCYRFLNSNRFAAVAAINDARRLPLDMRTPFILFSSLDKHLFNGKLSGMVLLVWRAMGTSQPGTTCATRVVARRICIQLNSTPFEERVAGLGHLLEMLVHHMIHAYFLVCCGAQKPGEAQDGRMLDGLHFGVILSTINDITLDCREGSLNMAFHAAERHAGPHKRLMRGRGAYISLDPVASTIPAPAVDGKTHCMHDNRNVTRAHIMNWQVQEYGKCSGENWESRGEQVFFWCDGQYQKMRRQEGPPSKYYSEIIWDNKRFAVPKNRATKYAAMKKLGNENRYGDMKLPDCSADVFDCIWKFVTYGYYQSGEESSGQDDRRRTGPAVLLSPHSRQGTSLKLHIQICKLADTIRFTELRQYALALLYEIPSTSDDPIALLRDVYNPSKPLSIELQSWTRKFLARTEQDPREQGRAGLSNYEKIYDWHQARFTDVFSQHALLREDCHLVLAGLASGLNPNQHQETVDEQSAISRAPSFINESFMKQRPFLSGFEQPVPFAVPVARSVFPDRSIRFCM